VEIPSKVVVAGEGVAVSLVVGEGFPVKVG
jgi:hypothetical protein